MCTNPPPMLERTRENLEAAGIGECPGAALGDAGYWSEGNVLACGRLVLPELFLPELFLATTKDWKQRNAARERGCPKGGASPRA